MSANKPYSLHRRTLKKGVFFYAQFRLPDGKWTSPKNTGEKQEDKAIAWCLQYLNGGQVVQRDGVTFEEYAKDFFAWDGRWALNKRSLGKRLSQRHCLERADVTRNHLVSYFGKTRLTAINDIMIDSLRIKLYRDEYAPGTINKILMTLRTILKSAHRDKLIQSVPEIQMGADTPVRRRGRLTAEEARRLFAVQWTDRRAFVAALIAAAAGLRLSEIQALQTGDIDFDNALVHVRRGWDRRCRIIKDTTKSGRARRSPLPLQVLEEIKKLMAMMPKDEPCLFYSDIPGKPVEEAVIVRGFRMALVEIGITAEIRQERGISFHSFRYLANSLLVEARIPTAKIHESNGHADDSLTERYFRSENQDDIRQAIESALFVPDTEARKVVN